ncbi:MAG: M56 family metallopeptidase, partial [Bacteroidota bacterium]
MNYLIHASLLLAGCFVYYWLLLRRETHFRLNRWVLLGCLVGSLTLPLVTVPAAWSLRQQLTQAATPEMEPADETMTLPEEPAETILTSPEGAELVAPSPVENISRPAPGPIRERTDITIAPATGADIDWWKTAWWIYLAGVLIFGCNFLIQFGQLVRRLIRYPGHDLGAYRLVELSEDAAPYSFWNRIFLNPDRYDPDTFHQIFQHEQIHVAQKHSVDLILAELLVVFQWFNPFAWLYRKAIEDNLEFLTDAEMLRRGTDPVEYQLSLVQVAVPNH